MIEKLLAVLAANNDGLLQSIFGTRTGTTSEEV